MEDDFNPNEFSDKEIPKSLKRPKFKIYFSKIAQKVASRLFDFFMLFLAVFSGFLADNWREQISEHKRELVFINSFIEDLKSDNLESNKILEKLIARHDGIDSILNLMLNTDVSTNSNAMYESWTRNLGLDAFVSNDRTIQQLKSSGELRLIRNKAISDQLMKYDQLVKQYYTQSELMYYALTNVNSYTRLFNFISLNKHPDIPVPLTEEGKQILNEAYAHLFLWNRGMSGLISWLRVVNTEGKNLVEFIEKEYDLE